MSDPGPWLALAALAVLIWYLVEWDAARARGQALSPLRHPALLLVQAVRRLARARQFMLPLLAFWLLSGLVYWGLQRPMMIRQLGAPAPQSSPRGPAVARQYQGGFRLTEQPPAILLQRGWEGLRSLSGEMPGQALGDVVPGFASLHAGLWPGYSQLLFTAIVLLAIASMVWHRPAWLGRANVLQPRLALAFLLVPLALMVLLARLSPWHLPSWLSGLAFALTMFAVIPMYGPVWHVLLQIAQGRRRLSLTLALRGAMVGLMPLTVFLVLILVVPVLLRPLLEAVLPARSTAALWRLPELLQLALLFVPWIILRDRVSLRQALRRHWQLVQAHWRDLLPFTLRYMLLLFPLQYVHVMLSPFEATLGPSLIGSVLGGLTSLVMVTMAALLYLELERATPRLAPQPAAAPSPRAVAVGGAGY